MFYSVLSMSVSVHGEISSENVSPTTLEKFVHMSYSNQAASRGPNSRLWPLADFSGSLTLYRAASI